jgi:hypothetical protein
LELAAAVDEVAVGCHLFSPMLYLVSSSSFSNLDLSWYS